ncbi:MAG: sugar transporter [Bacteroidales bacterium]
MAGRIAKSIKNAKVGLVFCSLNLLFTFFARRYFIDFLGSDLLGLNSIVVSLLSFLNIAELGIAAAVAFSLYTPLFQGDHSKINAIISIQGYLYRNIALFITAVSLILIFFFPFIFEKVDFPLYYAYATFFALLVNVILGYVVNYKQIIFQADQKNYTVTYICQGGKFLKIIAQILILVYLDPSYSYWLWLSMEVISAVFISISLEIAVKKYYPYLKTSIRIGKQIRKQHVYLLKTTKQVFFHKIGGFALMQTSPLVIYTYANLNLVTIFENYNLILLGTILLISNLFNGLVSAVGNLIAENIPEKITKIYWELFAFRTWLSGLIIFGFVLLCDPFISLWLGKEFIMPRSAFFFLTAIFFLRLFRENTDIFLSAFGLYKDIWAPITEAVLNIGLSFLLGYYWGLTGILCGVFISLFLIIFLWKPYFLFKEKMNISPASYFKGMLKHLILLSLALILSYALIKIIPIDPSASFAYCALYGLCILVVFSFISLPLFYFVFPGMRDFFARIFAYYQH